MKGGQCQEREIKRDQEGERSREGEIKRERSRERDQEREREIKREMKARTGDMCGDEEMERKPVCRACSLSDDGGLPLRLLHRARMH